MSSIFSPRKQTIVNDQAAANIDLQKAALAKLTNNPAFDLANSNLSKINARDYGSLPDVQALQAEGSKALRANRYNFTRGAAALNNNPNIRDAMMAKSNNQINEDVALAIPGVLGNVSNNATNTIQNAYGNQASGYSDAAKTSLEAYKTLYKPSIFSTVLGAAAPFLNFIPGVGPVLAAGAGAVAGATGGGGGQSGSAAGLGQFIANMQQNKSIDQIANLPKGITMPGNTSISDGSGATNPVAAAQTQDVQGILQGTKNNTQTGTNNSTMFDKFSSNLLNNKPNAMFGNGGMFI